MITQIERRLQIPQFETHELTINSESRNRKVHTFIAYDARPKCAIRILPQICVICNLRAISEIRAITL